MEPFTAIPNWLLEAMPQMPASVFQVACVIARQTLGYSDGNGGRREWDQISVSQFQVATGLSRQGTQEAIIAGLDKWFIRREIGQSFEYQLCNSVARTEDPTELTMQLSAIAPCNSVARLDDEPCNSVEQQPCNSVASQNKDIKKDQQQTKQKERTTDANAPAQPSVAPATSQAQRFEEFRELLQQPKTNRAAVLVEAYKYLFGADKAPNFGRMGKFAKHVGSAALVLELMWNAQTRRYNGEPLDYIEASYRARRNDRGNRRYRRGPEVDEDEESRRRRYIPEQYADIIMG